jgi:hypothetical protein
MRPTRDTVPLRRCRIGIAGLTGVLIMACASTQLDAQWADPARPAGSLRGARVLVACEAHEVVIRRICQDHVAAEVVARGATPVLAPEGPTPTGSSEAGYASAARAAGARAVLTQQISAHGSSVSPGLSVGAGVGVSAPIGGGQISTGYAANSRITDVASGRVLWTAKASSPPSQDVQTQMLELTRKVFDSADRLGLF